MLTWCGRSRSAYVRTNEQILLGTKVTRMEALDEGIRVTFEGEGAPAPTVFGPSTRFRGPRAEWQGDRS